ncbi:MAG: 2Fe-2S iron-sulfur cluster-binding protein [Planctomycetota bacterium]
MLTPADPLLFYGGAAMCAAAAGQATLGGIAAWRGRQRRRRDSDRDADAFRAEVQAAAEAARARLARQLAWDGRRTLRVAAAVDESPDTRSFYLTDPDGRALPSYLPGQHLTLALPAGPGGAEVVRCYSLSDRPRPEYYRITVKRQGPPDGEGGDTPPGVASHWLHRHARTGATLRCEAPRGAFFYHPAQPRPAVFVGAGVGVTPLMAMLAAIDHSGAPVPTQAVFGFRDGAAHLFADPLREMPERNAAIRTHVVYSRPREQDRLGVDYHSTGRVTIETLRRVLPSSNFEFFVCGPPRMMQSLVPELIDWGVPLEAIHYEAFGPASVSPPAALDAAERAVGSAVSFEGAEPLVWDGAHASLLELAEAAGVPLASGCRAGNCGSCRVRVLQGKVAELKRPGVVTPAGECLACISLPDGPVVLEA